MLLVEFGDGVPADVEPALAAALRLPDDGRAGRAAGAFADRIVEVLAVRRQLVVLDHCEHVADEVAGLVEAVTAATPDVDLLLTSREPLRIDGEHVLGVDPLELAAAAELRTDRIRTSDPTERSARRRAACPVRAAVKRAARAALGPRSRRCGPSAPPSATRGAGDGDGDGAS